MGTRAGVSLVKHLEALFPGLTSTTYAATSPKDPTYNCIAWAAGDTANWWWPGPDMKAEFWPPGVPRVDTLAASQAALASLGYSPSPDERLRAGVEKIAIYADARGEVTHAADNSRTAAGPASWESGKTSSTSSALWKEPSTASPC
jgi:hypothetical protein